MSKAFRYDSEAAMCDAFIRWADSKGWLAYPETCDYDIVLVHRATGAQIAVEAKQQFNAKVLNQVASSLWGVGRGPDFRAVLVPDGGAAGLSELASHLCVSVIRARNPLPPEFPDLSPRKFYQSFFDPGLPEVGGFRNWWDQRAWFDLCPPERLKLPDYVPDTKAGDAAPIRLTEWKISAIKLVILLERRGHLTPADFKALKIHPSRWTQSSWLQKGPQRGLWLAGRLPNFRREHPTNYQQIESDFEKWGAPLMGETSDLKARPAPEPTSRDLFSEDAA
ncbi:MAG: hypothetical protein AAGK02_16650 [Pseudomonadota bacterium]